MYKRQVLNKKLKNVLFAGIASKSAYDSIKVSNTFTIGGTFGGGGPSLKLKADSVYFKNKCAVVNISGSVIIISKLRRPFHYLQDFIELNLDLKNYKILVVKSGYLSPELQLLSAPSYMALTNGCVNQDLIKLKNNNRLKKIFPFQDFQDYTPEVSDGENLVNQ